MPWPDNFPFNYGGSYEGMYPFFDSIVEKEKILRTSFIKYDNSVEELDNQLERILSGERLYPGEPIYATTVYELSGRDFSDNPIWIDTGVIGGKTHLYLDEKIESLYTKFINPNVDINSNGLTYWDLPALTGIVGPKPDLASGMAYSDLYDYRVWARDVLDLLDTKAFTFNNENMANISGDISWNYRSGFSQTGALEDPGTMSGSWELTNELANDNWSSNSKVKTNEFVDVTDFNLFLGGIFPISYKTGNLLRQPHALYEHTLVDGAIGATQSGVTRLARVATQYRVSISPLASYSYKVYVLPVTYRKFSKSRTASNFYGNTSPNRLWNGAEVNLVEDSYYQIESGTGDIGTSQLQTRFWPNYRDTKPAAPKNVNFNAWADYGVNKFISWEDTVGWEIDETVVVVQYNLDYKANS